MTRRDVFGVLAAVLAAAGLPVAAQALGPEPVVIRARNVWAARTRVTLWDGQVLGDVMEACPEEGWLRRYRTYRDMRGQRKIFFCNGQPQTYYQHVAFRLWDRRDERVIGYSRPRDGRLGVSWFLDGEVARLVRAAPVQPSWSPVDGTATALYVQGRRYTAAQVSA